jgi:hypothetical protein
MSEKNRHGSPYWPGGSKPRLIGASTQRRKKLRRRTALRPFHHLQSRLEDDSALVNGTNELFADSANSRFGIIFCFIMTNFARTLNPQRRNECLSHFCDLSCGAESTFVHAFFNRGKPFS